MIFIMVLKLGDNAGMPSLTLADSVKMQLAQPDPIQFSPLPRSGLGLFSFRFPSSRRQSSDHDLTFPPPLQY